MKPESSPVIRRKRSSLAMMLVLVACVALMLWGWRRYWESGIARDLARSIREGSSASRARAMTRLWEVSPDHARTAIPSLFAALDDPDPEVRAQAMASLFYLLHERDPAGEFEAYLEKLLIAAKNPDPVVRAWAVGLLGSGRRWSRASAIADALPADVFEAVMRTTSDPDAGVREVAFARLHDEATTTPQKVRVLARAVADPAPRVRASIVRRLSVLAPQSPQAMLAVVRALNDPSAEVRTAASKAWYAPTVAVPVEALPDLIQAFQNWEPGPYRPTVGVSDDSWQVRSRVLHNLEKLGPAAAPASPSLVERLPADRSIPEDPEAYSIIGTLGAIAPGSAEARVWVPSLLAKMKSREPRDKVLRSVAFTSVRHYLWAPEIVAMLREIARDEKDEHAAWSAQMLNSLKEPPAPP